MKKSFHILLVLTLFMAIATRSFAQEAHNEKLDAALKKYEVVIQSMPQHPLSDQALNAAKKVFLENGAADDASALNGIVRAMPDSRIGLYALEKILEKSGDAEMLCRELIASHKNAAAGTYALNFLLDHSDDPLALCQEIAASHPGTRLSAFVATRLGDDANAQGHFAEAESHYFQAGLRALPKLVSMWKDRDQWMQGMLFPNAPGWSMPSAQQELFEFAKAHAHTLWGTDNPEQAAFNEALWQAEAQQKSVECFVREKGAYPWQWQTHATLRITKKHIKEGRVHVGALTLEYLYSLLPDGAQPNADYVFLCVGACMFVPPKSFEPDASGQFSISLESVMEAARLEAVQMLFLETALRSLPLLSPGVQTHFMHLIAMHQAVTNDIADAVATLEQVALIPGVDASAVALTNSQIEKLKSGEWKHEAAAAKQ